MFLKNNHPSFSKWPTNQILEDVQANIFQPHGRRYASYVFFEFQEIGEENTDQNDLLAPIRQRIHQLSISEKKFKLTSGLDQKNASGPFKQHGIDGGAIKCLGFSGDGLKYLFPKKAADLLDTGDFFRGLSTPNILSKLNFAQVEKWQDPWSKLAGRVHLVLLIADNQSKVVNTLEEEVIGFLTEQEGIKYLFTEKGRKLGLGKDSYEPFGFKDGLSNPHFFNSEKELRKKMLKLVLDQNRGSYFTFCKFSQEVDAFEAIVDQLTKDLFFAAEDEQDFRFGPEYLKKKALVEAQIVGRFKSGEPLIDFTHPRLVEHAPLTKAEQQKLKWFNQYHQSDQSARDYGQDNGIGCPFFSHIRKVNPRKKTLLEEVPPGYDVFDVDARITRRGIPFSDSDKEQVGLLFSSYQANIGFQFERIVADWANEQDFPLGDGSYSGGLDPIFGKSHFLEDPISYPWVINRETGETKDIAVNFQSLVSFLGGEYFYAPAISWFESLNLQVVTQNN